MRSETMLVCNRNDGPEFKGAVKLWESIEHKTCQKTVDKTVKKWKNGKKSEICPKSAICNSQFLSQKIFKKYFEVLRNFYFRRFSKCPTNFEIIEPKIAQRIFVNHSTVHLQTEKNSENGKTLR